MEGHLCPTTPTNAYPDVSVSYYTHHSAGATQEGSPTKGCLGTRGGAAASAAVAGGAGATGGAGGAGGRGTLVDGAALEMQGILGLTAPEVKQCQRLFRLFDSDNSGSIDIVELKEVMRCLGCTLGDSDIHDLLSQVDEDGSGEIEYPEFLFLIKLYKESCRFKTLYKSQESIDRISAAANPGRLVLEDDLVHRVWGVGMLLVTLYFTIVTSYADAEGRLSLSSHLVVPHALCTALLFADMALSHLTLVCEPDFALPFLASSRAKVHASDLLSRMAQVGGTGDASPASPPAAPLPASWQRGADVSNEDVTSKDKVEGEEEGGAGAGVGRGRRGCNPRLQNASEEDEGANNEGATRRWSQLNVPYMQTWFVLDLLSALPCDLLLYGVGADKTAAVLGHLRLLRLVKVPFLFKVCPRPVMPRGYARFYFHYAPLIRGIFWWITALHVLACVSIAIEPDLDYITSLYWVLYTITSVGYGDVLVSSHAHRILAALLCVGGLLVNGIMVGMLTVRMQKADVVTEGRAKMAETLSLMSLFKVPETVQEEILAFQYHQIGHTLSSSISEVFEGLPSTIKDNINMFMKLELVRTVHAFARLGEDCRITLAASLQPATACPEEILIMAGDTADAMYIIAHGFVDVMPLDAGPAGAANNNRGYTTLQNGDIFGTETLFGHTKFRTSVKSLTYCDLLVLPQGDVSAIVKIYPAFLTRLNVEGVPPRASGAESVPTESMNQSPPKNMWGGSMEGSLTAAAAMVTSVSSPVTPQPTTPQTATAQAAVASRPPSRKQSCKAGVDEAGAGGSAASMRGSIPDYTHRQSAKTLTSHASVVSGTAPRKIRFVVSYRRRGRALPMLTPHLKKVCCCVCVGGGFTLLCLRFHHMHAGTGYRPLHLQRGACRAPVPRGPGDGYHRGAASGEQQGGVVEPFSLRRWDATGGKPCGSRRLHHIRHATCDPRAVCGEPTPPQLLCFCQRCVPEQPLKELDRRTTRHLRPAHKGFVTGRESPWTGGRSKFSSFVRHLVISFVFFPMYAVGQYAETPLLSPPPPLNFHPPLEPTHLPPPPHTHSRLILSTLRGESSLFKNFRNAFTQPFSKEQHFEGRKATRPSPPPVKLQRKKKKKSQQTNSNGDPLSWEVGGP